MFSVKQPRWGTALGALGLSALLSACGGGGGGASSDGGVASTQPFAVSIALDGFSGQSAVGLSTKPTFSGSVSMTGVKGTSTESLPTVSVRVDVSNCVGSQSFDATVTLNFPGTGAASGTFTATPKTALGYGQTCTYTITPSSGTTIGQALSGTFTTESPPALASLHYTNAILVISQQYGTVNIVKDGRESPLVDKAGLGDQIVLNARICDKMLATGHVVMDIDVYENGAYTRRKFLVDPLAAELLPFYSSALPTGSTCYGTAPTSAVDAMQGTVENPAVPGVAFGLYSTIALTGRPLTWGTNVVDATYHSVIMVFSHP